MKVIRGHFDGKGIVLDEPVPEGVPANARVEVVFDATPKRRPLDALLDLTIEAPDLPADFAAQHEHYIKGTPKKP